MKIQLFVVQEKGKKKKKKKNDDDDEDLGKSFQIFFFRILIIFISQRNEKIKIKPFFCI